MLVRKLKNCFLNTTYKTTSHYDYQPSVSMLPISAKVWEKFVIDDIFEFKTKNVYQVVLSETLKQVIILAISLFHKLKYI